MRLQLSLLSYLMVVGQPIHTASENLISVHTESTCNTNPSSILFDELEGTLATILNKISIKNRYFLDFVNQVMRDLDLSVLQFEGVTVLIMADFGKPFLAFRATICLQIIGASFDKSYRFLQFKRLVLYESMEQHALPNSPHVSADALKFLSSLLQHFE